MPEQRYIQLNPFRWRAKHLQLFVGLYQESTTVVQRQGVRVYMIRADNERENIPKEIHEYCQMNEIKIETALIYAPESNGKDERFVQEHRTRAMVMKSAINLPAEIWDEALSHTNWLRNRLPSSRINFTFHFLNGKANIASNSNRFRNLERNGEHKVLRLSIIPRTSKERSSSQSLKLHTSLGWKETNA